MEPGQLSRREGSAELAVGEGQTDPLRRRRKGLIASLLGQGKIEGADAGRAASEGGPEGSGTEDRRREKFLRKGNFLSGPKPE
jgi:hypothetical protein